MSLSLYTGDLTTLSSVKRCETRSATINPCINHIINYREVRSKIRAEVAAPLEKNVSKNMMEHDGRLTPWIHTVCVHISEPSLGSEWPRQTTNNHHIFYIESEFSLVDRLIDSDYGSSVRSYPCLSADALATTHTTIFMGLLPHPNTSALLPPPSSYPIMDRM